MLFRSEKAGIQTNVKCVAHRGYHPDKAHPENSIAALQYAQELGVYGAEFDVWITTDGGVYVHHDETHDGTSIPKSTSATVSKITLSNGETLPTFRAYLEQGKKVPSVKMVLELKTQPAITGYTAAENNERLVNACVQLVKEMGMEEQVEWIAFNYSNCLRVRKALPNAVVQDLYADKSPSSMVADGINAIDYSKSELKDEWIAEAHRNNMFVNVWTVNLVDELKTWIIKGVDVITTNSSADLMKLLRVYVRPGE